MKHLPLLEHGSICPHCKNQRLVLVILATGDYLQCPKCKRCMVDPNHHDQAVSNLLDRLAAHAKAQEAPKVSEKTKKSHR